MANERILMYSHDTYGLGHLRRTVRIAEALSLASPGISVLIASGSPQIGSFATVPGVDTLKLPSLTKTAAGSYASRSIGIEPSETIQLRSEILRAAASGYRPDMVLVDHAPAGAAGELVATLSDLTDLTLPPRFVLGLRDIIDEPTAVQREWDRLGAWPLVRDMYDLVLVYGDPQVLTTAQELELSTSIRGKLLHTGFLADRHGAQLLGPSSQPSILVTTGGGADGHHLLRGYVDYLRSLPNGLDFHSTVVTGPLLAETRKQEVAGACLRTGLNVTFHTFVPALEALIARAHGVVAMAGYNTTVEILAAGTPAFLDPREHPRLEQRLRADRLAPFADIQPSHGRSALQDQLAAFVDRALNSRTRAKPRVRLDGLDTVVVELTELLGIDIRQPQFAEPREVAIA